MKSILGIDLERTATRFAEALLDSHSLFSYLMRRARQIASCYDDVTFAIVIFSL